MAFGWRAAGTAALAMGVALFGVQASRAATMSTVPLQDGSVAVSLSGKIDFGDTERLADMVRDLRRRGVRVSAVRLESGGGLVPVGLTMAELVRREGLATVVEGTCASACFSVFAAGRVKLVGAGARLGVHMPHALDGNSNAWAAFQAERYRHYGVPRSIVAKMTGTPYNAIAWLSPDDERAMGVRALGL